jgi:23S rRNA (uracil1939-C5)-methyltransferase
VELKSLLPAYGGYTIARDEKVILIRGAIPGEVVEVAIEEKKRDYSVASVTSVIEASEDRVVPECPVFGICGGCQLQFISHQKQVLMKDEIISDSMRRIGGIEVSPDQALTGQQWNYRRRAQFKVSREGEIGLFRESSRDIVTFERCPLMDQQINILLEKIKRADCVKNLSEIHMAVGDSAIAFLKGKELDRNIAERFLQIGFSGVMLEDNTSSGVQFTKFDLNGLHYTISPGTFFQAHWSLNLKLVDYIIEHLSPLEGKQVLDLYSGAGNFSLPLARHGAEVTAVEENPSAVEDGLRNAELNGMKNCRFLRMPAEKYKIKKKFDILLLDPPRPGLTSEMAGKILDNPPAVIAYISCNPATLSRDLKKFKEKYEIQNVRQIDFFPNTFHVETIAFLQVR